MSTPADLRFCPSPPGAAPIDDATVVVLDPAWTPSTSASRTIPIRHLVGPVLERTDLFTESLRGLDAWAMTAGIEALLTQDGVSWWPRVRVDLVQHLHGWIVWRGVLGQLGATASTQIEVPDTEPGLAAVAAAVGQVRLLGPSTGPDREGSSGRRGDLVARVTSRVLRYTRPAAVTSTADRVARLEHRLARLRQEDQLVLAVTQPSLRQVVGAAGTALDPQLDAVVERGIACGWSVSTLALGFDHRDDADWAAIADDDRMLPQSMLRAVWADPPAEAALGTIPDPFAGRPAPPLEVDGADLGPLVAGELVRRGRFVDDQRRYLRRVRLMLEALRPRALLMNHEGIRTPWVAGAALAGVPVFAVQHGLIYPMHPVYRRPGSGAHRMLPTLTFVGGEYERGVLTGDGGYDAARVAVSGSPRLDLDLASLPRDAVAGDEERRVVRDELGVAPDDRLLVVSTAAADLYRRFHLPHLIERVLGGPLPRVHVVFKLHPGERDDGPYRAILEGLARAGGFDPPPVTVVRDIDLYRLLRAADAHLGLHSTVLTDAVVAGTLNLLASVEASGDFLRYVERGVAVPVRTPSELLRVLDAPPALDDARRTAFLAQHFRSGDATQRIVDAVTSGLAESSSRVTSDG